MDQRATRTAPTMPIAGSIQVNSQVLGAQQGHDGQDRGERVGEHVEVRGAEVVVVVRVLWRLPAPACPCASWPPLRMTAQTPFTMRPATATAIA